MNDQGDYGYVIQESVQTFIKPCKPLTDYIVSPIGGDDHDVSISKSTVDTGHFLHFSFMQGYGNAETFGKDRRIFCD